MITFTVQYKLPDAKKYEILENVKGDGIVEHNNSRFFILEDETRIEIPVNHIFIFSKERYSLILERMSKEAGQEIQIDKH